MIEHAIFDLDMYGAKDSQGQIKKIYDVAALKQALTKWIVSPRYSKVRDTSGGSILSYLGKPLNESNADSLAKAIQIGLKTEFYPVITPVQLSVTPDYVNKKWVIKLVGYVYALKEVLNYEESINYLGK